MLKRVFTPAETLQFQLPIAQAVYPATFSHTLEFNPPAHGVWNIIHVGMLLPQSVQIFVCSSNCMRGVVLTAEEMGAADRFYMVLLKEQDLSDGSVEAVTLEGVSDILSQLPALPPVVLVFTVCTHRFLSCDLDYIYRTLQKRFPSVTFLRCFMEPITQKEGLSPDQRLRKTIYDPLCALPPVSKTAVLLGSDLPPDTGSDLFRMFTAGGWQVRAIQDCADYADFLSLGSAEIFICVFPRAYYGARETAARLHRPCYYLPASFSYTQIRQAEASLAQELQLPLPDADAQEASCEEALAQARALLQDTPLAIDYTVHPRPLGLARLLLDHGFRVERIYLNAVDPSEEEDFYLLQKQTPQLMLCSVLKPQRRVYPRGGHHPVVAIGQIAAWCEDTPHFVNLTEGGGLWGYDGIRRMAGLITDAYLTKKDTQDLIPRKGWGCESCL